MLRFQQPYWLLLLLLVPAIYVWRVRFGRRLEGVLRYSSFRLFDSRSLKSGNRKVFALAMTKLILLTLIILALARPQLHDTIRESRVEVIDIMLVIDISSSMRAADFKPNRLEAAKVVARQFILDRPHDRIGIVVFAGDSFIQCPLTNDTNVLLNLLSQVAIVDKEHDGTAIGMAIANAINRLRDSAAKSKVMILLSDGSNNAGELDPTTAAQLASEFGMKVYTVGAGSRGTAPYPVDDPLWGKRMVNVEVDLDEETLREVASLTGGRYFRATDQDSLALVYQQINELERTEIEVKNFLRAEEVYSWLVTPATIIGLLLPVVAVGVFRKNLV
jgi:Ca-activated chloride channel family protein